MSENVFADLGFENPEEELLKARLVGAISQLIKQRGLTQEIAGERMGLKQPKVSALLKGHWEGYSVERLLRFVEELNGGYRLIVTDEPRAGGKVLAEAIG